MNFWHWLEKLIETRDDDLPDNADVVIAIGIDVSKDGRRASPFSEAVILNAFELFKSGKAQNILITGGYSINGLTEAEAMKNIIEEKIDKSKLFLETKSFRTVMNADNTLPILRQLGWKSTIIVAQQWHARRVRATFKKRWNGSGIKFFIKKAQSEYGGGSQRRLNHFIFFVIWDTFAFIISKIKGFC